MGSKLRTTCIFKSCDSTRNGLSKELTCCERSLTWISNLWFSLSKTEECLFALSASSCKRWISCNPKLSMTKTENCSMLLKILVFAKNIKKKKKNNLHHYSSLMMIHVILTYMFISVAMNRFLVHSPLGTGPRKRPESTRNSICTSSVRACKNIPSLLCCQPPGARKVGHCWFNGLF